MFELARARGESLYRGALDIARRLDDRQLEFVTRARLGASLVHGERTEQGMAMLDQALAAVVGDEVEPFCMYECTTQLATLAPPPPEVARLLGAVADDQGQIDALAGVIAGTVSPATFPARRTTTGSCP